MTDILNIPFDQIHHDKEILCVYEHLRHLISQTIHPKHRHLLNYGANEVTEDYKKNVRYFICYSAVALAEMLFEDASIVLSTWHSDRVRGHGWAERETIYLADPECFEKIMKFFIKKCGKKAFPKGSKHYLYGRCKKATSFHNS